MAAVRVVGGRRTGRARAALAALVLLAAPVGCSGDAGSAGSAGEAGGKPSHATHRAKEAPTTSTKVLQPGRPGEKAETLPPGATLPADQHNAADVRFLRMMIPHHAQALEMGALARTRARDQRVSALADRIRGAQGPEIVSMSAWLAQRGVRVPSAEDLERHAGHSMPGMLSPEQMRRLRQARGGEFDRLFLRFMIQHHQGAVQMSEQVSQRGRNIVVQEVAADIAATQTAEIDRMRQVLRTL